LAVHRDAASRLELAYALGEDIGQHLEVLVKRYALSLQLLLMPLPAK
jgi:hypothetical protein